MAPHNSVAVPAVRKRRMTPKVRTGCLTCRQRHVKCDERKPTCQRCESHRAVCKGLGYGSSIMTKPFATSLSLQRYRSVMSRSPSEKLPCKEVDIRYFQLFQAYSATDLSGYFQSEFWSRLLFQQSHYEPSIMDAIVAIGALYKSIEIAQSPNVDLNAQSDYWEHLKSAFQHYQRAIGTQREAVEIGYAPSRTALISCLLFICFEALQGDQDSVLQQVYCGVNLLREYESTSAGGQSSLEGHIDEELSQIFARLELQLRTVEDGRPQRYSHPRIKCKLPDSNSPDLPSEIGTDEQEPSGIRSLQEARRSWDHLFPRVFHARQNAEPYRYSSQEDVPIDIVMGVKRRVAELLSWRKTFDYLFQDTWNDICEKNRLGASAIRISYHLAYVKISTSFELMETIYDSFDFDFREIVRLSRYLIQTERPSLFQKTAFSLDSVLGIPLFVTGMKCRDRVLRREASALLRHPERREGMWDSAMGSVIVNWMIAIEEAGLEPDQIVPEGNRFRMLDLKGDLRKRRIWVRCGQRIPGAKDYVNVRELDTTY